MRYFWFVIFMLSVGSVSAQNSARVRELEKQRKAAPVSYTHLTLPTN